jgi:DNA-binding CsgD family transcriptional regulator
VVAGTGEIVRSAEWLRVRDFVATVRSQPAAMAIAGEAGSGKTTLWRGGTAAAAAAGHRLLRSEPSDAESDLPFSALSDLLTDVLSAVCSDIPDPQREALEVALLLRRAGPQPPVVRAVGMAVLTALRMLAAAGQVVVAIDDVQWMDEASLDALTFAFRRSEGAAVRLLVAARTEAPADPLTAAAPPPPGGWRDLVAAVPAEIVELAPLDAGQIQQLLHGTFSAAQARMIARQSRGNPFWAREIASSLAAADTPLPALARTLTDRLARSLTEEASAALAVVAGAGRIPIADVLAVLSYLDDPADAVDQAVLAGVVVEAGNRLTPAHPLIGAAAVESLPPGRRRQLYRRLAATSDSPERYAHFAALAAAQGPDAAVADALDAAAAAASARAGNAEAAQFAGQAVQFTPDTDRPALTRRRIRAAELYFLAGDLLQSLAFLEALSVSELATADLERALPLLLDMTEIAHGTAAASAIIGPLIEEPGPDVRRRALVLALASDVIYGIPGGRQVAAAEAIRCAEAAGTAADATMHRAMINLVTAKMAAGEGLDGDILDRAELLESKIQIARLYDTADLQRGIWSAYVEDFDTGRAALERCISRARESGDDFALYTLLCYLATTEELAGDFRAARQALAAADSAMPWHDWPLSPWHVRPHCSLLIADGDLDSALSFVDQHLPGGDDAPATAQLLRALVHGWVSTWRGDTADAVWQLERAGRFADKSDFADPAVRQWLDPTLAQAYITAGRSAEALRISAWLRKLGQRRGRPAAIGHADRIEALAHAKSGDLDGAAASAHAAVAIFESSTLRFDLARSLFALGQIERRRKARGHSRAALGRALDLANEIGHVPLRDQAERELARVAAARSAGELTATERRVADLIAAGATNREAAAELFVSVRTVETHVASVYRKLGVRTRAELARRLADSPAR